MGVNRMDDLISRQAVIDALYDWSEHSMTDAEAWHIKQVIGDIKSLPSAQPERKTGRWISVTNGRGGHECDLCHNYAPSWQTGEEHLTDFCPNCGAYMREG